MEHAVNAAIADKDVLGIHPAFAKSRVGDFKMDNKLPKTQFD